MKTISERIEDLKETREAFVSGTPPYDVLTSEIKALGEVQKREDNSKYYDLVNNFGDADELPLRLIIRMGLILAEASEESKTIQTLIEEVNSSGWGIPKITQHEPENYITLACGARIAERADFEE